MTVWGFDTRLSREAFQQRRNVQDMMRLKGSMFIIRQVKRLQDKPNPCPRCFDEVLKQSRDSKCPLCGGTGYEGGYEKPEIIWGSLSQPSIDEDKSKVGVAERTSLEIKTAFDPMLYPGDIFAEVRTIESGDPKELGRVFKVGKPIRVQMLNGMVSDNYGDDRPNILEDQVISQSAPVNMILATDDRHIHSSEFWKPYTMERVSTTPYFPKTNEPESNGDPTKISELWSPELQDGWIAP